MAFLPRLSRSLAVVLAAAAVLLATAGTASAHARLKSSNPADGKTVTEAPNKIELVFSEEVGKQFTTVIVTGPDGKKVGEGKPEVNGDTVVQPLTADLANGRYAVAFRVVSVDGHPISEELHFTLKAAEPTPTPTATTSETQAAATPTVSETTTPAAAAQAKTEENTGGTSGWIILAVVAAVVLAGGVVTVMVARRGRQSG